MKRFGEYVSAHASALAFAAAVCVPLAILAVVGFFVHRQIEEEAVQRAERTAQALSEHALRTLRAHDLIINAVEQYLHGMSWQEIAASPRAHRFLAKLAEAPDVNTVFAIAPSGTDGISSLRFPLAPIDVRDRSFFAAPRDGEPLHVSTPDIGRLNRLRFFSLARRKSDARGNFDGIVSVSVNPEYFEKFYATMVETAQDSIGLYRGDGAVLARIGPSSVEPTTHLEVRRAVEGFPLSVRYALSRGAVWSAWRRNMLAYGAITLIAMVLLLGAALLVQSRTRREALAARRFAEEAARREAAEEASRTKDEFLATLSHELRNPLSAISMSAELLGRSAREDAHARQAVGIIARQSAHLRSLLDDLLDVARTIYGKVRLDLQPLELLDLSGEITAAHAQGPPVHVSGTPAWVLADPTRLRQMIENLLDNARKFGARRIDVRVKREGERVHLSVEDDGEGIAPDLLPRLFQPFVQGRQAMDRARGGLGLGLSLVHRLAVLHGGSVHVSSPGPGQGSCFTLVLPAAQADAPKHEPLGKTGCGLRQRVLIVEDHADSRESLKALLELHGHVVASAPDALQALAAFSAFDPQVALVDIGLPGMDGYAWVREVRQRHRDSRCLLVAVTGYGREGDRQKARAAGFDHHLTKPVSYSALASILEGASARERMP